MTRNDKLLLLAIIAVLALVAAHAFLSVDFVKGGKKVISRVELKNLDPANNGINIEVKEPWFNPNKELSFKLRCHPLPAAVCTGTGRTRLLPHLPVQQG